MSDEKVAFAGTNMTAEACSDFQEKLVHGKSPSKKTKREECTSESTPGPDEGACAGCLGGHPCLFAAPLGPSSSKREIGTKAFEQRMITSSKFASINDPSIMASLGITISSCVLCDSLYNQIDESFRLCNSCEEGSLPVEIEGETSDDE